MIYSRAEISGMKITVMGLGLHGGGTASALFFASHGAEVTVTDLRTGKELKPSIQKLESFNIKYVLGRHEEEDFSSADMVIKNPGVPSTSPFLQIARLVETDISVFLRFMKKVRAPLVAVTGSKGKSTTVSALHHILLKDFPRTKLGGNITVSPLTFTDEILDDPESAGPLVLELSSWQLADLRGKGVLQPDICCITNILHDHQNKYETFQDYIDDKKEIYLGQNKDTVSLFNFDDTYGRGFGSEAKSNTLYFSGKELPPGQEGGWLRASGEGFCRFGEKTAVIVPENLQIPGTHNRLNLLCAGIMAAKLGVDSGMIQNRIANFQGIPHRLEFIGSVKGIRFYNDSAATIPDAVLYAVECFRDNCVLITGGTDKDLDFSPYERLAGIPVSIILFAGSATEKIIPILRKKDVRYSGPSTDLAAAVREAAAAAGPGGVVLFSPGCASFEHFQNEFDRGNRFKEAVAAFSAD